MQFPRQRPASLAIAPGADYRSTLAIEGIGRRQRHFGHRASLALHIEVRLSRWIGPDDFQSVIWTHAAVPGSGGKQEHVSRLQSKIPALFATKFNRYLS